jgi:HIP---CoA ligase
VSESSVRGDLEWGTTPRLLHSSAERFSAREAIVDVSDGRILSFAGLATAVHDAARAFLAMGIERGDRVAIWAPNVWEWVVAAVGLQSAGAVLVPLNTRFKGREAAYILGKSRAKALVTVTGFLDTDYVTLLRDAVDVDAELPDLEAIVVLRGEAPERTTPWPAFLAAGSVVDSALADARAQAVEPGDLSDILFTSGTTGNPKGAMLTHAQTLRAYRDWSEVVGLREHDRYLIVNPFFHAFGYKAGWLSALMMGATTFPQAVFDPAQVFERIPRDRITVLPGPPTL